MSANGGVELNPGDVQEKPQVQLSVSPEMFPGVYANYAELQATEREVTLDFYRIGPGGLQGLCVARLNLSPSMLGELESSIGEQRSAYAARSGSASASD